MKLKELVSCYLTNIYDCNKDTFEESITLFQEHANTFETDWKRFTKSEGKVVFKKGASISLIFDYSSTSPEVQVIFEFDPEKQQMKVSVGNWGFPFEPLMSKKRYIVLSENIHSFIKRRCDPGI